MKLSEYESRHIYPAFINIPVLSVICNILQCIMQYWPNFNEFLHWLKEAYHNFYYLIKNHFFNACS